MLNEKEMINDYLSTINASLSAYGNIISQTDNEQLRQAFIQMRNGDEARQRRVYEFATQHHYYQPASEALPQEIHQVKSAFQQPQATNYAAQPSMFNPQQRPHF